MNLPRKYMLVILRQLVRLTPTALSVLICFIASCNKSSRYSDGYVAFRDSLEKKVYSRSFPTDSILNLLDAFTRSENYAGMYVASCELGNRYRAQSDFSRAIEYHQQSLDAAIQLNDTISIAQAYNNIGTNLRRIGGLPEASDYHYRALQISERFHDTHNGDNQKNRVMALNGIGNIALTLDNFDEAESKFREALRGEATINSQIGQAINYANLGSIFQKRKMFDTAYYYYELSMIKNQMIRSKLGIGLCHKHLGEIHEEKKEYAEAKNEFLTAYTVMDGMEDRWHWLEACLAMARINIKSNQLGEAMTYLVKAQKTAEEIKSPEHLSQVYALYEMYYSRSGRYKDALESNKLSVVYLDSINNVQKTNQIADVRINYERQKNLLFIEQLNKEKEIQIREKKIIIAASAVALLLLLSMWITLWYAFIQRTKKNRTLREMNKVRTDFYRNITHEFRTPLTIILGHSQQLQKKSVNLTQDEKYYLSAIERQGERMFNLVNQMLEMTKLSSGMDKPQWKNGDIVMYAERMIDNYYLFAEEKAIALSFTCEREHIPMDFVPNYVDGIFQNLLSNAIKYTPPQGHIHVSISNDDKNVYLEVKDDGIGINDDEQERIFDAFYQSPLARDKNGSGIGLAFTKQLVERMHGKIGVKSKIGQGSVFTVTLPLKTSEDVTVEEWDPDNNNFVPPINRSAELRKRESLLPHSRESESINANKPIILVVEDNLDVLFFIKSLLKEEYNVVTATDGVEGLEKALRIIPDVIVTDIMMSRKDGLTLCKEIKASTALNHIPVIMITAKITTSDMLEGLKLGADAYLAKPFQAEELLFRISNLLALTKAMKEKYMKAVFQGEIKDQQTVDVNMAFLKKTTEIIHKKINDPNLSPQQIADSLHISLSQLNRKINAISGYSTNAYILHVKINHSKKLLARRDKNISEVAEACGFFDLAYFSRTFKKHTGITPSQFRNLADKN